MHVLACLRAARSLSQLTHLHTSCIANTTLFPLCDSQSINIGAVPSLNLGAKKCDSMVDPFFTAYLKEGSYCFCIYSANVLWCVLFSMLVAVHARHPYGRRHDWRHARGPDPATRGVASPPPAAGETFRLRG